VLLLSKQPKTKEEHTNKPVPEKIDELANEARMARKTLLWKLI
jgi:hypothetical protein